MKDDDLQKEIARLKDKVRILTEENEILTEKAEDIYLLGIVSEKIGLESTEKEVIPIAVENIVNIKDISYCSFLLVNNDSLKVIDDYGPNISASLKGNAYDLREILIAELESGAYFSEIQPDKPAPNFMPLFSGSDIPNSYCLVPVIVREKLHGILLTVSCFGTSDYLHGLIPLLVQVGDIVRARLEALSFINEIKELNKTLEWKVQERTASLRDSEEKYRNLVNGAGDAILTNDPGGMITSWNRSAWRIFGYETKEVMGKHISMLVPPELWDEQNRKVSELIETGFLINFETERLNKSGKRIPVELTASVMRGQRNEIAGISSIIRDISERKKLENELQKSHKLESVGILAGGIAHDFNNLLSAIQANVFIAKMKSGPDSKTRSRLDAAEKAIKRAADLTQQLMTFSRGGAPIKKTKSMAEIIRGSCDLTLRGSNVKCEFNDIGNIWPVDVDEGQMSQVFHNLIINADQSMPEGGEIVILPENVTIHSDDGLPIDEGNYVKTAIKDRGTGIAEEHRQKIFDPYFTTKEMGRGLGLAITYSIVKNHGGHITVESQLGAGTTFTLYIPASEKKVEMEALAEETLCTGQGKILLMDDEEMIRSSLGEMLKHIGYDVTYAKDGSEAIDIYLNYNKTSEPFDAVILDLTVPGGMGGEHTMKKLREIDPEVKGIVSSGYASDPVMSDYRKYGFSGIILKPFKSPEEVSMTLNRVINRTE